MNTQVVDQNESARMGRFSVQLKLANDRDVGLAKAGAMRPEDVCRTRISGIVDSGAAHLVLPEKVVKELGLPDAGHVKVRCTGQRSSKRKRVSHVLLEIHGRESVFTAIVEPKRDTALIGAIVLEELDLVVDCAKQVLHPRDPDWIISEIE
ncbi:MAG: aspartyl protease family protein [Planctomycetaceae bacterium]